MATCRDQTAAAFAVPHIPGMRRHKCRYLWIQINQSWISCKLLTLKPCSLRHSPRHMQMLVAQAAVMKLQIFRSVFSNAIATADGKSTAQQIWAGSRFCTAWETDVFETHQKCCQGAQVQQKVYACLDHSSGTLYGVKCVYFMAVSSYPALLTVLQYN